MIRTAIIETAEEGASLPSLVDRAAHALSSARTAAEILEAHDLAGIAYDMAKKAARMAQAKGAHDTLVAAAHRARADALLIESRAERRLADEYDAAQDRGEVRSNGDRSFSNPEKVGTGDLNLSAKLIHHARRLRDAENDSPGFVEQIVTDALERGDEPTRALVNKAISEKTWMQKVRERGGEEFLQQLDQRDFRAIRKAYLAARPQAQAMFRDWLAARS